MIKEIWNFFKALGLTLVILGIVILAYLISIGLMLTIIACIVLFAIYLGLSEEDDSDT